MFRTGRLVAFSIGMAAAATALAATPPTPEAYFRFQPGTEGKLIDYEQLSGYLKALDQASPRVEVRQIGSSPLGKPMLAVFISSAANIARLDELAKINRRLALDPSIPDAERSRSSITAACSCSRRSPCTPMSWRPVSLFPSMPTSWP